MTPPHEQHLAMTPPHEQYHDLMTDVLFGEASDAERRRLEAHLDACEPCADAFASLRATLRVASRRERPELPAAYWDSYRARLEQRMRDEAASQRSPAGTTRSLDPSHGPSLGARLRRWWASLPAGMPQTAPQWAVQGALLAAVLVVGLGVGVWIGERDATAPGGTASGGAAPLLSQASDPPRALSDLLLASEPIESAQGSVRPSIAGVEDVTYDVTAGLVEIRYHTVNDVVVRGAPDDPAIQRLLRTALLDERNPASRLHAVKTLESAAVSPDDELVQALTYLAREETDVHMRIRAVRALRAVHERAPVEGPTRSVLIGILLESDNDALRIEALQALTGDASGALAALPEASGDREVPAYVYQIRNDANDFVRTRAEQLLRRADPLGTAASDDVR